jgi:HD-GYP domain-containing protein (c-di-GMP phosphodiesterase class II)
MGIDRALEELRQNVGTQFDPGVAWTVIRLVEEAETQRAGRPLAAPAPAGLKPATGT